MPARESIQKSLPQLNRGKIKEKRYPTLNVVHTVWLASLIGSTHSFLAAVVLSFFRVQSIVS